MGLDIEAVRFLLQSHRNGVRFTKALILGRQEWFLSKREASNLLKEFGFDSTSIYLFCQKIDSNHYSEPFWELLGAKELDILDVTSYEGANLLHDLNHPIPDSLANKYDVVCDIGTLEHIFNFPIALRNCMKMVKEGGHLIIISTGNNFFGHGFYQFSPELFFRTINETNGFLIERICAVEYGPRRRWFQPLDPDTTGLRNRIINCFPVLLFIQAIRMKILEPLVIPPQQSDYVKLWKNAHTQNLSHQVRKKARLSKFLLEIFPKFIRFVESIITSPINRSYSWKNRKTFKPINKFRY